MRSTAWLGIAVLSLMLGSCVDLGLDAEDGAELLEELLGVTTFKGEVTNPTGFLQRDAEKSGAYCCALTSTLYVAVVCENGEVAMEPVDAGGEFEVTIDSTMCVVMVAFVVDTDSDGDLDVFEGTLTFSVANGTTTKIVAAGGIIDLGEITLGSGVLESCSKSDSLLAFLDADGDGVSAADDFDDNNDGVFDGASGDMDEDGDGVPDCFDSDNSDFDDQDSDGIQDGQDIQIQIVFTLDLTFTLDVQ